MKKTLACLLLAFFAFSAAFAQGQRNLINGRRGLLNRSGRSEAAAATPAATPGTGATSIQDQLKEAMGEKGTNGVPTRLAFDKAPIDLLLYAYADVAGKILLPSPNLPKTEITLKSWEDRELTKEEYLEAIEVALTMHGVVVEPFDNIFLRAFERKTVRTQGIRTAMNIETNGVPEKGKVISQLIRLSHITAEEGQKALEGFKSPEGLFQVFERNNSILITDTQENINRMLEIVKELDLPTPVTEDVFTRQIQFAVASEIKTALETIVTESQKDTQAKGGAPKESGAPGFGSSRSLQPISQPNRLLNLRPGANKPETPVVTPNATMLAQVSDADRGMIRGKVLILADDRSNKLIVITEKTNMDFFDKVIETLDVETTPEVSVEVIRLKYADAEDVASMLNDLIGNGASSSSKNNSNANAAKGTAGNKNLTTGNRPGLTAGASRTPTANPTFAKNSASALGELNKDNIKILDDKRINGIVIMARKADMKAVKEVIEDMDVKLSQVLIETVIVEVTLGDGLTTGMDWVQRGRAKVSSQVQETDSYGRKLYWESTTDDDENEVMSKTTEDTGVAVMKTITTINKDALWNNGNYMLGGGGGDSSSTLQNLVGLAASATTNSTTESAALGSVNPIAGGINYYLKSDKLNIAAVIQATKTDSRAKYLASPIVMTVDNKEATVEATSSKQFLTGWQAVSSSYAGSGMPSPTYTSKDIGITLKMTPKINPNGTVMLTVEEEYSQVSEKQSMLTPVGQTYQTTQIDVPATRKMSSDVLLENRQTVVLGGLIETSKSESETGIPILKDIPWIGKWLFGSTSSSDARKELMIFLTPYVLDDADVAQAEALRRKKAISDPRPWEDNGWSASPLADPVSKKEQLRRLEDEWKRQDEERQNKKAMEEAKMKRAKKLAEMDVNDRKEWVEKYQKEVDEEMERYNDEQKDLRELVDSIRKKHQEVVTVPAAEPGSDTPPPPPVPAVEEQKK